MSKIDTESLKSAHNIVDYINQYVPLKKAGANHVACCPFHNEKSPSFTVNEAKQFYHCFGCGVSGNVIDFAMNYQGVEFIDACKMLGADIDLMPSEKVKANQNRVISSLPSFDARLTDEQLSQLDYDPQFTAKIIDVTSNKVVNIYDVIADKFLAGGISHLAGAFLNPNESLNFIVCCDYKQGFKVVEALNCNALVAFSPLNIKLICEAKLNIKTMPLLTPDDTYAHNLADVKNWIFAPDYKSTDFAKYKKGCGLDKIF